MRRHEIRRLFFQTPRSAGIAKRASFPRSSLFPQATGFILGSSIFDLIDPKDFNLHYPALCKATSGTAKSAGPISGGHRFDQK